MELRSIFEAVGVEVPFKKDAVKKVVSIEESAVVFIGIGSHISSLR